MSNPAVEVKKEQVKKNNSKKKVYINDDGVKYRLVPVSAIMVQAAMDKIPDPVIRTYTDKKTGKELPNPAHPDYARELKEVEHARQLASMDAMVMFGIEIIGEIPEDNKWIKQMLFMELISEGDAEDAMTDDFAKEFYYKKFKMGDPSTIGKLGELSGITEEKIASATKSFPSDA